MEPVEVGKPESVKKAKLIVTAAVVAALAVSTGIYLVTGSDTGVTVNITSITLHLGYGSTSDNFFGSAVQVVTANYETYGGGQTVSFTIAFHNHDSKAHRVTAIFVKASGFDVVSENPNLPVTVNPGQTSHITVNIQVPDHNFAGTLDIYSVVQ
ncbi:hypothetical protein IX51_01665 [uncultured archaeon]|nr:hypothetical protein IX51_01665 [uncultured archaeon]